MSTSPDPLPQPTPADQERSSIEDGSGITFHLGWIGVLTLLASWSYVDSWVPNKKWFVTFTFRELCVWTVAFLALALVGAGVTSLFLRAHARWNRSYTVAAVLMIVVQSWPPIEELRTTAASRYGGLTASIGLVVGAILLVNLTLRVASTFSDLRPLFLVVAAFLVGAHYVAVLHFLATSTPKTEDRRQSHYVELAARPSGDVLVVVLDAYGRNDVLEAEFGLDNDSLVEALRAASVRVVPSAKSNYSKTTLSVAGLLDGRYPAVGDSEDLNIRELREIHSGANELFRNLKLSGYQTHLVENAWSFTRCGTHVDVCHAAATDEIDAAVMNRTPISTLVPSLRISPWVRRSVDQLRLAASLVSQPTEHPRLIYVHALLPHAPFQLTAECQTMWDPLLDDYLANEPGDVERLTAAYANQVLCVNSLLIDLVEAAPPDTSILIAGDHGPGLVGRLPSGVDTSPREILATRGILLAHRFPASCSGIPDGSSLMLAAGYLFDCLGFHYRGDPSRSPWQQGRYFASPRFNGLNDVSVIDTTLSVSGVR